MALKSKEDLSPAGTPGTPSPPPRDRRAGADTVRLRTVVVTADGRPEARDQAIHEIETRYGHCRRLRTAAPGSGSQPAGWPGSPRSPYRARRSAGPVQQGAGGQSGQADPVPDRLHDPALFSLPTRAGPDRDQGGRLSVRRLGHDAPGRGTDAGAGHRRRRAPRPGQGAGQEVPRPGPGAADDVLGGLSRGTRRPGCPEGAHPAGGGGGRASGARPSATPRAATANSGSSGSSSSARWPATTA